MSDIYKEYKLKNVSTFEYGKMPDKSKFIKNGFPIFSGYRVVGFYPEYMYEREKLLIIARGVGGTGEVRLSPPFSYITNLSIVFNENESIVDYKYLYYYLSNMNMRKLDTGSCQSQITINQLEEYSVKLPEKTIQLQISNILTTLDSKIALNNRINAELEAMAKTVYDYWFVQFDFPFDFAQGKPCAEGKPYKSSGGKMVWSEELKREVPVGWEVKPLDKIIETIIDHRGKTPLKLGGDWAQDKNGIIALSAKHVKGGKLIKLDEANVVTFEMFEKWMSSNKLQEGDILMTSEAPCGEFYLILKDTDYCLSQRLFAIRANQSIVKSNYLYFELSKGNGYSQILGKQSGSTVFGIRQDELRTVNVLIPDFKLQELFQKQVTPMLYQIRNNEQENQQLSSLRDWLLPMLMNGQVKVSEL